MRIVFVTTQGLTGSTLVGRVMPLAEYLAKDNEVHVFGLLSNSGGKKDKKIGDGSVNFDAVGFEPFVRTAKGKKKHSGIKLVFNMGLTAIRIAFQLSKLKPDAVIVVKTLPHNVFGVALWRLINKRAKVVIDVDDFELMANSLNSMWQRMAIHWAERKAVKLGDCAVAASPFLSDHIKNLRGDMKVFMIPTGATGVDGGYALDVSKADYEMVYIGSVSLASGHKVDLLPEILKLVRERHKGAKLLIAGSGDDVGWLKGRFKELGLDGVVDWRGRFDANEVSAVIGSGKVLIDPVDASISNRAKSSYRVCVAGSYGLPVVTSNVGIRPKLLPDQLHERFFAKQGDAAGYVDKIAALLDNPLSDGERELLVSKSEEYSRPVLADRYRKVIEEC